MSFHQMFKSTGSWALIALTVAIAFKLIAIQMGPQMSFVLDMEAVDRYVHNHAILNLMSRVWLVTGLVLIAKMWIGKEPKGLGFKLALPGLLFFLALEVLSLIAIFAG